MCTTWVPVVPVVGAAPLCLCLVPLWHRVRCDVRVVCWFDASTAAWLGGLHAQLLRLFVTRLGGLPFVARVAWLACIGGLAFVVCAFGGFLLWLLPAYAFLAIASLCNSTPQTVTLPKLGYKKTRW